METQLTFENLLEAAMQCLHGVKWKNSVAKWERNIVHYCSLLAKEISDGKYHLTQPVTFDIYTPKHRTVNSLIFRDRVVHRAMCNTGLYDDLTRGNYYDNAACQIGKGTTFATDRLACWMNRHYRKNGIGGWVLNLDVRKFFDSIPHDKLIAYVYRKVRDPQYRIYVTEYIRANKKEIGLGLGSQIAQLLATAYLSPIDYIVKQVFGIEGYVRYMDNMVAIIPDGIYMFQDENGNMIKGDAKDFARFVKDAISIELGNLGVALNPKSCLHPFGQGIAFCGFKFNVTQTGHVTQKILKSKYRNARKRLIAMRRNVDNGRITEECVRNSFVNWAGHAMKGTNGYTMVRNMANQINGACTNEHSASGTGTKRD